MDELSLLPGWSMNRGVKIFSNLYDSAYALGEFLSVSLKQSISLYASSSSSKLFEDGKTQAIDRELLKKKARVRTLKVLLGTDAASTGLNLQTLGSLINLDLPWNPTTLEQCKDRVQRVTVAKQVTYCNLRNNEGVEASLFNVITGRIKEITDIFVTTPNFNTDMVIEALAQDRRMSEDELVKMVAHKSQSPFNVKERYEYLEVDWESNAEVLNSKEAIGAFPQGR